MTDDQRHDDLHELLVPYSLGELGAAERARVEQALVEDESLREELASIEEMAAQLVASVPHHAAPPALKRRVLDAVGAASAAEDRVVPPRVAPAPVVARPPRWRRMAFPALSGALAAACVVLLVWAFDLRGQLDDARTRPASSTTGDDTSWLAGAKTYPVSTNGSFKAASGRLLKVDGQYLLLIEDLPKPEPGTSWQVWTAEGDTVRNVAQWTDGRPVQLLVVQDPNVEQVMISHEQTTQPVATPGSAPLAAVKV